MMGSATTPLHGMFATRERDGEGEGEERARDRQSLCVRTSRVGHVRGLGDSQTKIKGQVL